MFFDNIKFYFCHKRCKTNYDKTIGYIIKLLLICCIFSFDGAFAQHQNLQEQQLIKDSNVLNINLDRDIKNIPSKTSSHSQVFADKLILNTPVIDAAYVLTDIEKQNLTNQLQRLHQSGLVQAAVVIVPSTGQVDIFDYAMLLAERWQLGQKDVDNGLLVVVALNDRKIHILTGYGIEGVLPDAIVKRVIREQIQPYFAKGRYAEGLQSGLMHLETRLIQNADIDYTDSNQPSQDSHASWIGWAIAGLVLSSMLRALLKLNRVFAASLAVVAIGAVCFVAGIVFVDILIIMVIVWLMSVLSSNRGGTFTTGGGFSGSHRGGFDSGGFRGGGGRFGGGGAGGSW